MKFAEIQNLSDVEIYRKVRELKKQLVLLKMKNAVGQLADTSQFRKIKKDVARLLTAIYQRKKNAKKSS